MNDKNRKSENKIQILSLQKKQSIQDEQKMQAGADAPACRGKSFSGLFLNYE